MLCELLAICASADSGKCLPDAPAAGQFCNMTCHGVKNAACQTDSAAQWRLGNGRALPVHEGDYDAKFAKWQAAVSIMHPPTVLPALFCRHRGTERPESRLYAIPCLL
jgi:hypothetical protein